MKDTTKINIILRSSEKLPLSPANYNGVFAVERGIFISHRCTTGLMKTGYIYRADITQSYNSLATKN